MCCLFGLMDYRHSLTAAQKTQMLSVLSRECEARGTDATGIAYNVSGKLRIYKRPVPAHFLRLRIPEDAAVVMGHTRMTTQGNEKFNRNNHPFPGRIRDLDFALAHNGVLYNDVMLRRSMNLPQTKIQTDSYIAVQLIQQKKTLDLSSLAYMAEQVEGSFAFTVLDEQDNLYFVKGDNPLCIYRYPRTGLILYASTEEILKKALSKMCVSLEKPVKLDISCGDILQIDRRGKVTKAEFDTRNLLRVWRTPHPYACQWDDLGCWAQKPHSSSYIQELKSVAGYFGYSAEDVDHLLAEGFSPEELEEYFYCQEL